MAEKIYAIITGATSGIGAEFARQLAGQGYNLIISGRRREVIEKVARDIEAVYGVQVQVVIVDFLIEAEIKEFIRVIRQADKIEVLINNAGFGLEEPFYEDTYEHQEGMIRVHVQALTAITHAVIPKLIANGKGSIINVSSMAPMIATPSSPLYAGTKAYINSFSESLYISLMPHHIKVQALCPGFTKTDFHAKLGWSDDQRKNAGVFRWMEAEKVVRLSLKAIRKNKVIFIPGLLNKLFIILIYLLRALPGGLFYFIADHGYKRFNKKK